ncbi:MAG TPA: methyltransferase [Leptospiraceae bacterium]|nr:methyltransferase [Leptospiraceae bacterium]HMW06333.1 methyltransferase [Leptospiraceae bacterium]HMX30988.1 methyltransferase [Leptospiraceae bacterium]HMY32193.1 methyltransferase [Leptospiraceae bacterium]HMZ63806.1 methyltransferase [Leptospiraceae bacterium]
MSQSSTIILRSERWVNNGYSIGYKDGEAYFILGAIPEELVECKLIHSSSKSREVLVVNVLEPSKDRIQSDCEIFLSCGGCSFRHIEYKLEIDLKRNLLQRELIHKIPEWKDSLESINVVSGDSTGYRNNTQIKIQNEKKGFFRLGSNELVEFPKTGCKNLPDEINSYIQKNNFNNKKEIKLRLTDKVFQYETVESIFTLDSLKIKVAPNGFFQINRHLIVDWLNHISQFIPKEKKSILELFSGSGLISNWIANQCKELVGYEMELDAVRYATDNARINQKSNLSFIAKNLYKDRISKKHLQFPFWIVNPPRNGLGKLIIEQILEEKPESLLYSSCNYVTLAQDLKKIVSYYHLEKIFLIDFFPRTAYFETILILKRI